MSLTETYTDMCPFVITHGQQSIKYIVITEMVMPTNKSMWLHGEETYTVW